MAEEVRIRPLDRDRIRQSLWPIDDDLIDHLRSLVQGRPAWLDELWRVWRAQGVVEWRNGRWAVTPDARGRVRTPLLSWVELALRRGVPDANAYGRAREVVRTAALEGQRFTAEALATVRGEDVEELIEWIDDHLIGPDRLLEDDGFVERAEGVDPPELRCYRFRSALIAGVLRQDVLAQTNGMALAGQYAHALAAVYRWSPASYSAWTIARLATAADDNELVETTWRRANRLESLAAAARLGRFLVTQLDTGDPKPGELLLTVRRLVEVGAVLVHDWDLAETLRITRAGERAARALPQDVAGQERTNLLAEALRQVGTTAINSYQVDDGIAVLEEAVELSAALSDHVRTAAIHRRIANAYRVKLPLDDGTLVSARRHAELGLGWARRMGSMAALLEQAGCLDGLAMWGVGVPEEQSRAAAQLLEAVTILAGPAFRDGLVDVGALVGDLLDTASALAKVRRHSVDQVRFKSAMRRCPMSRVTHCATLGKLSDMHRQIGDIKGAALVAAQGLRVAQEIRSGSEATALLRLGICAKLYGSPLTASFLVLGAAHLGPGVDPTSAFGGLRQKFFPSMLEETDDATRRRIEQEYRADRGASLLREAFGIDVDRVDALNERLGTGTEWELRSFLLDVQRYCTA